MSRLIVISNRVMLPDLKNRESAGGLGVAVLDALKNQGGIWFGWSGKLVEGKSSNTKMNLSEHGNITFATMDLNKEEYEDFYNGYSNESLWPLFHYRLDLVEFSRKR